MDTAMFAPDAGMSSQSCLCKLAFDIRTPMAGDELIEMALYALAFIGGAITILGIILFVWVLVLGTLFNGDSNYPWEEKPHWEDPADE